MANIVLKVPQAEGNEKEYKFEFTRRTIIRMEEDGIIKAFQKGAKQDSIDKLVYYACLKNHPKITLEEAQEIVDSVAMKDLGDFIQALIGLLEKSINALENAGNEGNAHWEVN